MMGQHFPPQALLGEGDHPKGGGGVTVPVPIPLHHRGAMVPLPIVPMGRKRT
jgi:hypothetical protein